ncbi:hypothetical protein EYF80_026438 [Liparis tanakae]|uniref:Uncharacterized protein n=1 Tax=Liparis tanakae TaxID=230148 RepID=A0A4Z2HC61_9TELE|nr:hypothetical protein EYF80_026438 [Liparis tanakae]
MAPYIEMANVCSAILPQSRISENRKAQSDNLHNSTKREKCAESVRTYVPVYAVAMECVGVHYKGSNPLHLTNLQYLYTLECIELSPQLENVSLGPTLPEGVFAARDAHRRAGPRVHATSRVAIQLLKGRILFPVISCHFLP